MSTDRDVWMAWSDQDGGWIAAIHGSGKREDIEYRIARDVQAYGRNRFEVRPIRVTLHLADDVNSNQPTGE
jgi:hypothetical protein